MDPESAQWIPDLLAKRKHHDAVSDSRDTDSDGGTAHSRLPDEPEPPDTFPHDATTT